MSLELIVLLKWYIKARDLYLKNFVSDSLQNGLKTVCADVRYPVLKNGCAHFSLSNSLHHLPEDSSIVYNNIFRAIKPGGRFSGVEVQGIVSKLILYIIRHWPTEKLPFIISEIYEERDQISAWLSRPLKIRLKDAEIQGGVWRINRNLTHVLYTIFKPHLN